MRGLASTAPNNDGRGNGDTGSTGADKATSASDAAGPLDRHFGGGLANTGASVIGMVLAPAGLVARSRGAFVMKL